jgi:hypothetical protein
MYFPKACQMRPSCKVIWTHPYAHPQHMKVMKHCMCLTMKCKPSWIGLQPQYPHCTVVSPSGGIPIIPGNLKMLVWQDHQQCDKD